MGIDFDLKTFCQNLKATKPPYECPVQGCGRVYKSYIGIQSHLYNFDHDNPEGGTPGKTPARRSVKGRWAKSNPRSGTPSPPPFARSPAQDTLTYAEAQRMVEIDLDGSIHRLNIYEPLDIIPQDEIDNCDNTEKEQEVQPANMEKASGANAAKVSKTKEKNKGQVKNGANKDKASNGKNKMMAVDKTPAPPKLPEAIFKVIEDYVKPPEAPPRPNSYYRFIEKTSEEMDEEVEYDMDEEDFAWLDIVNEQRKKENLAAVPQEQFEMLMDRFEKEAFFQSQSSGKDLAPSVDEDAVCSICMDGECQNSNVILFCDMCNLAVHQECYGVPYIPEGQWLCRRCLQSPSRSVDCCLCPNKGGAFKQTDDNRWAHVVCALWIPEVGFANTVFLEPIDTIQNIPAARWKLMCYICKQRNNGACIQCHKTNCYTAFHVTCAQQAGLYMKIEPVRETGVNGMTISVRKTAFCDVHMPPDQTFQPMIDNGVDDDDERRVLSPEECKAKARQKMRRARKILAEKRNATPTVSIPVIPQQRLSSISSSINIQKKGQFLSRLQSYWTLKRQSRNGVPLLRRLQSNHMARSQDKNDKEASALKAQLKYWQRLRQDLEKARLLVELIRKREKLKREQLRLHQRATELQLQPFNVTLKHTLEQLQELDTSNIFAEPVPLDEVPDYLDHIKTPMDFSTMYKKVEGHEYKDFDQFESDFDLIVNNCMVYNAKDTVFYRAALKLRDQGGSIIRAARRMAEYVGFDPETGLLTPEKPQLDKDPFILEDVDSILPPDIRENMPLEEQLRVLLDKLDVANSARQHRKSRVAKQLKREIAKVRRQLALQKGDVYMSDHEDLQSVDTATTVSDTAVSGDEEVTPQQHPEHVSSPSDVKEPPSPGEGKNYSTPRRRGRPPGRPRKVFDGVHDEDNKQVKDGDDGEESKSPSVSETPSGINRRSAVLFGKKPQKRSYRESEDNQDEQTPSKKGPGRQTKTKGQASSLMDTESSQVEGTSSGSLSSMDRDSPVEDKSMSNSHKRTNSTTVTNLSPETSDSSQTVKQTPPVSEQISTTIADGPSLFSHTRRESFLQYRNFSVGQSDLDSSSDSGSTDSSMSDSDNSSKGSSSENDDNSSKRYSRRVHKRKISDCDSSSEEEDVVPLEPLDLVWAKCRGYPWYPALIINPKMPKTGYFHNGVPIPVPPEEVLNLQSKHDLPVYLVLFFDTKRTWQWLPRAKLEPLGVDSGLDKAKLLENKKPNVRKAVRKAYEKAILHRCKVTGEPNPLSGGDTESEGS